MAFFWGQSTPANGVTITKRYIISDTWGDVYYAFRSYGNFSDGESPVSVVLELNGADYGTSRVGGVVNPRPIYFGHVDNPDWGGLPNGEYTWRFRLTTNEDVYYSPLNSFTVAVENAYPTLESVKLLMYRLSSDYTDWNIYLDVYSTQPYTSVPNVGTKLGEAQVHITNLPLGAENKAWITFLFDVPIELTTEGYYGFHFYTDAPSNYAAAHAYYFNGDDWSDAASNPNGAGTERFYRHGPNGWKSGNDVAYFYVGDGTLTYDTVTVGTDSNHGGNFGGDAVYIASTGSGTGFGVRSYLVGGIAEEPTEVEVSATIAGTGTITLTREGLPGAPTNPSPVNAATNVNLSTGFSWTNGSNTDTTALHMDFGDGYFEIASGLESTAYALAQDLFDYGWSVKWKIHASNAYGTTAGPEWTFTALDIDPPHPSWNPIEGGSGEGPGTGIEGTDFLYSGRNNVVTSANLVAIANNRLWYSSWS